MASVKVTKMKKSRSFSDQEQQKKTAHLLNMDQLRLVIAILYFVRKIIFTAWDWDEKSTFDNYTKSFEILHADGSWNVKEDKIIYRGLPTCVYVSLPYFSHLIASSFRKATFVQTSSTIKKLKH